jgi:hypothetical protein
LPFLYELAPAVLLSDGMATGIAFLRNTALAVQGIVDHPKNIVIDILGVVTDAAFSRTDKGYDDVADARRGIIGETISKAGKTMKQTDDRLHSLLQKSWGYGVSRNYARHLYTDLVWSVALYKRNITRLNISF